MVFRILALDPGGTTGWATFTADRIKNTDGVYEYHHYNEGFACGQIGPDPHHKDLHDFLGMQQTQDFIVVCERFEYRNRSRAGLNLMSREYIGVLQMFHAERMAELGQRVVFQNASQGKVGPKSFVRKANLQKLGLWSSGRKHAMDAYGHLLYYMIHDGDIMRNELLKRGWR